MEKKLHFYRSKQFEKETLDTEARPLSATSRRSEDYKWEKPYFNDWEFLINGYEGQKTVEEYFFNVGKRKELSR